jgi:hypothetical protein
MDANNDNKANQCNPNSDLYQGHQTGYHGSSDKASMDNHSNQMNPNNSSYSSHGKSGGSGGSGGKSTGESHRGQSGSGSGKR